MVTLVAYQRPVQIFETSFQLCVQSGESIHVVVLCIRCNHRLWLVLSIQTKWTFTSSRAPTVLTALQIDDQTCRHVCTLHAPCWHMCIDYALGISRLKRLGCTIASSYHYRRALCYMSTHPTANVAYYAIDFFCLSAGQRLQKVECWRTSSLCINAAIAVCTL